MRSQAMRCIAAVVQNVLRLREQTSLGLLLTVDLIIAGSIYIPAFAPANITFYLDSDDSSLLMIDGNLVISDLGAIT